LDAYRCSGETSPFSSSNQEKIMSDIILALVLTFVLLAAMFVWVPLLQSVEALTRRYPRQRYEEMPDLREEDAGPQFTGKVA
jgi:hypothetical protein